MHVKQKITPFLSFNTQAAEAADFYVSILPDSRIVRAVTNPESGGVLTVEFQLAGVTFVALNVGQPWEFTDAFSLAVSCDSQEELDELWTQLSAGGREVQCGWLKDKFGVSWQIVPAVLSQLLSDPDTAKTRRVMGALMQMVKLDIAQLQQAYDGR